MSDILDDIEVYVGYLGVWQHYLENMERAGDYLLMLAENKKTGCEVYITEEDDIPFICVYYGDDLRYKERVTTSKDCENTARRLYTKYLFEEVESGESASSQEPKQESCEDDDDEEWAEQRAREDMEYERRDDVEMAFQDFLISILEWDMKGSEIDTFFADNDKDIFGSCFDDVMTVLESHGIPVYLPSTVEDAETGCKIHKDYPYAVE